MANQTGTLTSSQGSAIIGTSPKDTITFTPTSGTYSVEYPLGTAAISASTIAQSMPVSGGQLRLTCASGSVAWSLSDAVDTPDLTDSQAFEVQSLVAKGGIRLPADGNAVFTKYGVRAYDTCATNITIGTTTLTHSLANERPRFQTYTRKCVLSSAASEIRFASASFTADQTEKALSIDVYIEQMPSEFLSLVGGANPYITVQISNTTALGSNYSRWVFDAGYIRQGWNTLKMRNADTVSATSGAGNLPTGCNHPADVGTGFDWTGTGQFLSLTFTNMNGYTLHIDELRRPAKAKAVIVIGFDASGYNATDEIFVTKVAPLFATYGIRSYCTMTNIYELIFSNSQAWTRLGVLYNTHLWDVVNHTWNHGATEVGRTLTPSTLASVADLATFTSASHGLPINKINKISVQGASPAAFNGIFDVTVTTTGAFTYTATGAGTTSATGTIRAFTYLSEVLTSNNAENTRLLEHELTDIQRVMRANGFSRGKRVAVFPNNSVPELSMLQSVCSANGIRFARGYRGGYTFVNEFGIDNPLNMGSFVMDSGTSYTRLSEIQAKVQGCIDRGEHMWLFGHFILDDTDPANSAYFPTAPDYPPSQGGNPAPPVVSLSGYGGWWYYSQLRTLIQSTVGPAIAAGTLLAMSPSEYAAYMGGMEQ